MNAVFAAHRTVRNALEDRTPDQRMELARANEQAIQGLDFEALCISDARRARAQWEQRRNAGYDDGPAPPLDAFEAITGVPRSDPHDMETFAFAAIGANLLDKKWIHNVVSDARFPERWAWFLARATTTENAAPEAECGTNRQREAIRLPGFASSGLFHNPSIPPRLARFLYATHDLGNALYKNPATPTDVIESIAADGIVGALAHPALPVHVLREAFAKLEPGNIDHKPAFKAIARHPKCPRDIVQMLAGNPDRFVRREVAWRGDLDPFVRSLLAQDESPGVRRATDGSYMETWYRGWTDA